MALRIDGKHPMMGEKFDPDQLQKLKLFLDSGGKLEDLGGTTTTVDYDQIADRNISAALWVIGLFWGFAILLVATLAIIGLRTYCRLWTKPRYGCNNQDLQVMIKPA